MFTRRRASLSLLSMVAALTVPAIARATRILGQPRLPMEFVDDVLNLSGREAREINRCSIKVIGVGGGGCNAVEHMILSAVDNVEFICANTDSKALTRSTAHKIIQLGTSGLGAASKPGMGRKAAQASEAEIHDAIQGADMLFITAGMGGGTGTGASPVIARVAKEMGILTVGVVSKPFAFEGGRRMSNADVGLAELEVNVDSLIVVLNEKLLEVLGDDISQEQAFSEANDVLKNVAVGIAEVINTPGHVNLDLEDVRAVMSEPGRAILGTAVADGPDRSRLAAERAMAFPLMGHFPLAVEKGLLVLISGSQGSLSLSESNLAMKTIRAKVSANAHINYGTFEDDSLGEQIRVTVFAKV